MSQISYLNRSTLDSVSRSSPYQEIVEEPRLLPKSQQDRKVSLPYDTAKVSKQLKQLTLDEKISLLSGDGFATTAAIPRLGVPSMKLVEGINGVKDAMQIDSGPEALTDVLAASGPTTVCFPSTSCLGATWNVHLMDQLGAALASQARQKDIQVVLGPALNIHRDPRGGRNFEYFSEDPFLSGRLAGTIVNAIQREGVGACPKHVVANDAENFRRHYSVDASLDSREIREISMAAFQELLRCSNPVALMTSYNKVDGTYCSESPLIENIIRQEWGYDGAIMSDWFGTNSTVPAVHAGLDLEMPGPSIFRGSKLAEAVTDGSLSESQITKRALKMLEWAERTSHPLSQGYMNEADTIVIARQIAQEGLVLLKNKGDILPLNLNKPLKVSVVGQHAIDPPMNGGGSSLAPPQYCQRPLDTLREVSKYPELITFAGGVKCNKILPIMPTRKIVARNGANGVDVTYRNDGSSKPVLEEFQSSAQVLMLGHLKPGLQESGFTYEFSTSLRPESSGCHTIGVVSTGGYELYVDGIEIMAHSPPNCSAEDYLFDPIKVQKSCTMNMKSDQPYKVKLVVQSWKSPHESGEPSPHGTKLCFEEEFSDDDTIKEAMSQAKESDVSIVLVGRNPEHESEGFDLDHIFLPGNQGKMVKSIANVSRKTVVVIYGGGPFDVSDFIDDVDAIIHANYLGQEGGSALANIISGKVSPSGKLAVTWPKRIEDAATFNHFPATRKENVIAMKLIEGVGVGYRRDWPVAPRFAFGFGLSYTSFTYSNLRVNAHGSEHVVNVEVTNTGNMAAWEVVQVYVTDVESSVQRPQKELKGFSKVWIEPKKSLNVQIILDTKSALSFWNEKSMEWKMEKGQFIISVADLCSSITLENTFFWRGL